ncbi:MAG: SurA N-terminal domain-containing protein [Syntrophobacterales bacterium]|nr:SurA N-terminal domain-containing protein [Syntrophobacterales bacterium]
MQAKINVYETGKLKRCFCDILMVVVVVFIGAAAEAGVADRIVAVVNDEVITLSDLNRAFEPFMARFEAGYRGNERDKALDEAKRSILNSMIDNMLMEQEAKKTGISVPEGEIDAAIADIKKQRNLSEDQFRKLLEQEKLTPETYRKDVRRQMMRMQLIGRDIRSKVVATEGEIGDYYRQHREEYDGKESVRVRQILLFIPKEASPEAKAKIRADLEAIRQRLLKGESFEELCAKFSQGPGAEEGGDIGYIEKGAILPEIESVAFALPLNKISDVIESPAGFHIIQITDRRGAGAKTIELVREEIKAKLEKEKMEKRFEEWLKELREKYNVEIRL